MLRPLPTIPISASAHEFLQMEARNNSENIERNRNAANDERPLPPLPQKDDPLGRVDETPNDSDSEDEEMDDEEEIDEIGTDEESEELDESNDNDSNNTYKLVNGSSKDYDESFDADATLPPSPSKSANTFSENTEPTSGIHSNSSSQENPSSPGSER